MILLIDDLRNFDQADVIARTAKSGRLLLQKQFHWTKIYFDHDLGDEYDNGYKILTWALENDLFEKDVEIFIITANPVGRKKMESALEHHGYKMPLSSFAWKKQTFTLLSRYDI